MLENFVWTLNEWFQYSLVENKNEQINRKKDIHEANLSWIISFYSPWKNQKTMSFVMITYISDPLTWLNIRGEIWRQFEMK